MKLPKTRTILFVRARNFREYLGRALIRGRTYGHIMKRVSGDKVFRGFFGHVAIRILYRKKSPKNLSKYVDKCERVW